MLKSVRMGMGDVLFSVFIAAGGDVDKVRTEHVIDGIVLWVWVWL